MMIDRRTFVVGTVSAAILPLGTSLSEQLLPAEAATGGVVLMIEGWSVPNASGAADAAWIRVGRSWKAAWR
jgi:hypothetical protein